MEKIKSGCLSWQSDKDIKIICGVLKSGQCVIGSTDTVLGLFSTLTEDGFERLNKIKGRSNKPYLVVVGSFDKLSLFSDDFSKDSINSIVKSFWSGPLTLVVNARPSLPNFLALNGTIAIRIPKHKGLLKLLKSFDGLFSTSANKIGKPVCRNLNNLDSDILENTSSFILENLDLDYSYQGVSSTILDCTCSPFKIIRKGAYKISDIKKRAIVK